jgi:hypothetical protein
MEQLNPCSADCPCLHGLDVAERQQDDISFSHNNMTELEFILTRIYHNVYLSARTQAPFLVCWPETQTRNCICRKTFSYLCQHANVMNIALGQDNNLVKMSVAIVDYNEQASEFFLTPAARELCRSQVRTADKFLLIILDHGNVDGFTYRLRAQSVRVSLEGFLVLQTEALMSSACLSSLLVAGTHQHGDTDVAGFFKKNRNALRASRWEVLLAVNPFHLGMEKAVFQGTVTEIENKQECESRIPVLQPVTDRSYPSDQSYPADQSDQCDRLRVQYNLVWISTSDYWQRMTKMFDLVCELADYHGIKFADIRREHRAVIFASLRLEDMLDVNENGNDPPGVDRRKFKFKKLAKIRQSIAARHLVLDELDRRILNDFFFFTDKIAHAGSRRIDDSQLYDSEPAVAVLPAVRFFCERVINSCDRSDRLSVLETMNVLGKRYRLVVFDSKPSIRRKDRNRQLSRFVRPAFDVRHLAGLYMHEATYVVRMLLFAYNEIGASEDELFSYLGLESLRLKPSTTPSSMTSSMTSSTVQAAAEEDPAKKAQLREELRLKIHAQKMKLRRKVKK